MGTTAKKALIYDQYLDTGGGGERYCLTVGECLLKENWQVDLMWNDIADLKRAQERLNLDISEISLVKKPDITFPIVRNILTKKYDLVFWLSDGSIPFLFGKKNLIHIQRPFLGTNVLTNKFKLGSRSKVVCNSEFTKKFIDREYSVDSEVLYPPVDIKKFKAGKKENIIIGVGRFEQTRNAKRQDVLIEGFKKLVDGGIKNWKLVLVGSSLGPPETNVFLADLKKLAKGYNIEFKVNASFCALIEAYSKARIFWHAAGFGIDEKNEPWWTEHFGIVAVEAMASGCVPVVINKGGLTEIVRRDVGETWDTIDMLVSKTKKIISSLKLEERLRKNGFVRAEKFSKKKFCNKLIKLVGFE